MNSSPAQAPDRIHDEHRTFLLPMAYPEGCPTHPSCPAAHATVAGACATVLKAFYNEDFVLPHPVTSTPDGLSLQPYRGWRSDTTAGLHLGEKVAESILTDLRCTLTEQFDGFTFTGLDGNHVTV